MTDDNSSLVAADEVESGLGLDEEQQRLHDQISLISKEILAIFREDLPIFIEKEVKKRFLEAADFSIRLPKQRIIELRARTAAVAMQHVSVVEDALSGLEPWLSAKGVESPRQSITDNPSVWGPIRAVEDATVALLDEFGFPKGPDGYGVHYEPPARFIGRKFLKTLVEHYWRSLEELEKLQMKAIQQDSARMRAELIRKWDDI
ncbi:MAG: hypothetical protein HUU55_01480 [Myxococcales bacterium]|nr:hypothetical protein [Myxococcales bacterium]